MSNFQEISLQQDGSGNYQFNTFNFAPERRHQPILSNVRQGSKNFVGREEELAAIHTSLQTGQGVVVCAVEGMGGVGKSELALQYAECHKNDYRERYWLSLRDSSIAQEVVRLASQGISLPEAMQAASLEEQAEWYWQHWLPAEGTILIILDDVPNAESVPDRAMPLDPRFRVLLTTRERSLNVGFESVPLDVLPESKAIELLENIVGKPRVDQEQPIVEQVCKYLGYLPLGLELVGEYLVKYRHLTFSELQKRLNLADKSLKRDRPNRFYGHRGVTAALQLSWDDLNDASQRVALLLGLFAPVEIQWSLVEEVVKQANLMATELEEARGQLDNLHLIQPTNSECDFYKIHSLVREFLRGELAQQPELNSTYRRAFVTCLLGIAKQIPQTPTREIIETVAPAIPHLDLISREMLDDIPMPEEKLFWAFEGSGRYFFFQGLYQLAEELFEKCVEETKARLGIDHLDFVLSCNSLANYYKFQGRYPEAESLLKRTLSSLKTYTSNELLTVAILNNLAEVYKEQGRYGKAESLHLKSLAVREQNLGKDHIDVALSLNNLAHLYQNQGRYGEAESYYLKSISIFEQSLETNALQLATSHSNLASLYLVQERYDEAEPLYVQVLEINKQCYGDKHHEVASALNNLAMLYRKQGQYKEAETLLKESIEIDEHLLGEDHLHVASSLNNLAGIYRVNKRYSEAEYLYQKVLAIREDKLEVDHPDVAASLNNLAVIYQSQERYSEAESLYLRSIMIKEQRLGTDHPSVATSLHNLAEIYQKQGHFNKAESLYSRSIKIKEQTLGVNHSEVATSLNNLAYLYKSHGYYEKAEPLYLSSLAIWEHQVEADHPDLEQSLTNLAVLYLEQERCSEAQPLLGRILKIKELKLGTEHPDVNSLRAILTKISGKNFSQSKSGKGFGSTYEMKTAKKKHK